MTCHFVTILVIKHGDKQVACTDILNKFKPFVVYVKPVYDTFIYISDPCENAKYDFPLCMAILVIKMAKNKLLVLIFWIN